jgi:hypothetical protein
MARIEGVPRSKAGPMVKLIYRLGPGMMKKMTGRRPQTGSGIEPIEIWAHQPKMMLGMGRFNTAIRKRKTVDEATPASPTRISLRSRATSPATGLPTARRWRWITRSPSCARRSRSPTLALVNLDRFNAAFGIGSAGFSEGMVCVRPDRPAPSAAAIASPAAGAARSSVTS